MSQGRCAGCGEMGTAAEVSEHIRACTPYRQLFDDSPERALAPEEELRRWQEEDRPGERAGRKEAAVSEADRRRGEQRARWETPPDPLEDDEDDGWRDREALITAWEIIDG